MFECECGWLNTVKCLLCTIYPLRLLSISEGVDNLPCSVVLTRDGGEQGREEIIGHARLMPVAGDCTAAFIETGETISYG